MRDTHDHDIYVAVQELTPELLDAYPVIVATAGGRSYVALRSDKRIGGVYHRETAADAISALPTLWVTVSDYDVDTIASLLGLVEKSNHRRPAGPGAGPALPLTDL